MKNFKKDAKGITLLALVVTIIILIILATVSVNILVMDNGLIQKATGTGELAKDVTEDEHVKLAVADALITGAGKLSTDDVRNALKSEFGEEKVTDATFSGEGPWTFKGERKDYKIETNGKISSATSGNETVHNKEEMVANYGDKVDYIAKKDPTLIWRLFYDDENYVYLISSKINGNKEEVCAEDKQKLEYGSYSGSADIKDKFLQSLNSEWFKVVEKSPSTNDNAKAVAYLMDQDKWGDYKDVNGNASYAIGGPTLELFRNSFNATVGRNDSSKKIEITSADLIGYHYVSAEPSLSAGDNNGIYLVTDHDFFLASPDIFSSVASCICFASSYSKSLTPEFVSNEHFLRPVVVIPKSSFVVYRLSSD